MYLDYKSIGQIKILGLTALPDQQYNYRYLIKIYKYLDYKLNGQIS
jgi:hypothetical protein